LNLFHIDGSYIGLAEKVWNFSFSFFSENEDSRFKVIDLMSCRKVASSFHFLS